MANNILVGDIGSTKSVWRKNFGTSTGIMLHGYNPVVHDTPTGERLFIELSQSMEGIAPAFIYYFGTGVIDIETSEKVRDLAAAFFPNATITIESDMTGACLAACGRTAGTVAILGTGSNCAVFDGHTIIRKATTLGYMLGDEGSGSDIGRQLARAYFYRQMPEYLRSSLDPFFRNDRIAFLTTLYASGAPNQVLAECVKGIAGLQADPWIDALVRNSISNFIVTHLVPIQPTGPVHLVGSIGYIFSAIVLDELLRTGHTPGKVIRDPIQLLFENLNHDEST